MNRQFGRSLGEANDVMLAGAGRRGMDRLRVGGCPLAVIGAPRSAPQDALYLGLAPGVRDNRPG